MKIIVVGLNHKTAPVDIRERLAFDAAQTICGLRQLKERFGQAEFVLLSTCNRVELYSASEPRLAGDRPTCDDLAKFLSDFHNLPLADFYDFLYIYYDEECVRHLLKVACGLDSMVVGEPQIISQVKESYKLACTAKSTGKVLNRLFHCAFATSKKVHAETSIFTGRVSVAGFAVELTKQLFEDISSAKVVVIGAGEMGELLIRHLLKYGCNNITIVNRSYQRGLDRAKQYRIEARKWDELEEQLFNANIVIASAASQDYLFKKEAFEKIMQHRPAGPLLIIDIAVPRNFEPTIANIENVYLYSIDDLSAVVEENLRSRQHDIAEGTKIISEKVTSFMDWLAVTDIGPLIGQMKERFAQISRNELERFLARLPSGGLTSSGQNAPCREAIEETMNKTVNKLLHCVIKNVDVVAKKHGPAEAAKLLDSIVRQAEEISSPTNDKNSIQ